MNTKLLLILSLGLGSLAPVAQAMKPSNKKETPRERQERESREAIKRRAAEDRKEKAEQETQKKAEKANSQQSQPIAAKDKDEASDKLDLKEMMRKRYEQQRQEEKQAQVQAPTAPEPAQIVPGQEMEPVEEKIIPVESPRVEILNEENDAPTQPEQQPELNNNIPDEAPLIEEEIRAEERAQASMRKRDLRTLRMPLEQYLEHSDLDHCAQMVQLVLGEQVSKNAIQASIEQYTYLKDLAIRHAGDPEFTPFIMYLDLINLADTYMNELIDTPLNVELWQQLDELYYKCIERTDNELIRNALIAQRAANTASRTRIFMEFQRTENFDPRALIENVMNEAEQAHNQAQANQRAQDNATNELIAQIVFAQEEQDATQHDANLAAQMEYRANQEQRFAQERAGENAARRLQAELNGPRLRPNIVPPFVAPAPNNPDDVGDNDGDNTPRIPTPPAAPANPNTHAHEFNLNSFVKNPQFLQGLMMVAGVSIVGYIAYKFYNWMTTKSQKPQAKKRNNWNNKARVQHTNSSKKRKRN